MKLDFLIAKNDISHMPHPYLTFSFSVFYSHFITTLLVIRDRKTAIIFINRFQATAPAIYLNFQSQGNKFIYFYISSFLATLATMTTLEAKPFYKCFTLCFQILLLLAYSIIFASAKNVITHLPGFDGQLPFYLETG